MLSEKYWHGIYSFICIYLHCVRSFSWCATTLDTIVCMHNTISNKVATYLLTDISKFLHPICSMHFGKYRVAQKCKFIIKVKSRWDIIYCHQIWRDYYPFLPVAPTFIATRIEPLLFLGNLIWGHNLGSKTFLSRISLFFTGIHRHWNEKIRHSG